MSICLAVLARNEADRWLSSLLPAWSSFVDEIVVLDDGSTDDTAALCKAAGCVVVKRLSEKAWGAESAARAELWQYAAATGCDWLFFLDADMVPAQNPSLLFHDTFSDSIAFRLYDLWAEDSRHLFYREDNFWNAHNVPRVWAVRNPPSGFQPEWSGRGIHCGHLPSNLSHGRIIVAPYKMSLLHYGYLRAEDRAAKLHKYAAVSDQLEPLEDAHAASIADEQPTLVRLPLSVEYDIRYGR